VVIVDEGLVEICRIGQRDDGRNMRGPHTAYVPLPALWPEVVGYAFLLRFRELAAQHKERLDGAVDVFPRRRVSACDCFEGFCQLNGVRIRRLWELGAHTLASRS